MFFAVNLAKPGWQKHLLDTVARWRAQHPESPWHGYLLVDASFDQSLSETSRWRRSVACSLYDGTRLADLKPVAPPARPSGKARPVSATLARRL